MDSSDPDHLLAGLSAPQRRAVTSEAGLLCVVAGAGSGKTTVLTRRVAWRVQTGSAEAGRVLVVTFTRKAATELRSRLEKLGVAGVWAATFHSAAFALLRRHWADEGRRAPSLVAEPERILRRLLEDEPSAGPSRAPAVAAELAWARARLIDPDHYPEEAARARRRCPLPAGQIADLMVRYEVEKRRRRVMDLDDLVLGCRQMLEAGGAPADAVGWRIRHLFVDEFQDVSPAQWRLVEAWRRGRPDLCVVGDPRQSIYAFNGSDPTLLGRLPSLVPGIEVVGLDDNHRSSPQIVAVARSVLPAPLRATETSVPVTSPRPDGPLPRLSGFDDEDAEAAAVARWLRTTRRPGHPWRHLAVLARTNARLEPVAGALERAGIPGRCTSGGTDAALAGALARLRSMDRRLSPRAALVDVMAEMEANDLSRSVDGDHAGTSSPASQLAVLLEQLADEHAGEDDHPTVGSFLSWVAANRADIGAGADRADAVQLSTFHQAKGLQWRAVAVTGLEEGTMPIAYATDAAAVAEERRLLYVALTRAEEQLWCSWAGRSGTSTRSRGPSPFLDDVRLALEADQPLPSALAGARVSELRERLAATG